MSTAGAGQPQETGPGPQATVRALDVVFTVKAVGSLHWCACAGQGWQWKSGQGHVGTQPEGLVSPRCVCRGGVSATSISAGICTLTATEARAGCPHRY